MEVSDCQFKCLSCTTGSNQVLRPAKIIIFIGRVVRSIKCPSYRCQRSVDVKKRVLTLTIQVGGVPLLDSFYPHTHWTHSNSQQIPNFEHHNQIINKYAERKKKRLFWPKFSPSFSRHLILKHQLDSRCQLSKPRL